MQRSNTPSGPRKETKAKYNLRVNLVVNHQVSLKRANGSLSKSQERNRKNMNSNKLQMIQESQAN